MSDQTQPAAQPPVPERPQGRLRRVFAGLEAGYERVHRLRHLDRAKRRKHQAHFYALTVAIGVPLMGWLIHDFYTKLVIACFWFALAPNNYFWLEGLEIDSQIKRYGLLDQQESDYQRKAMYLLYFGVIFAAVVWVIGIAVYLPLYWPSLGWWNDTLFVLKSPANTPIYYGVLEWAILAHTVLIAYQCIDVYYPLISNFLQATAGQRRVEKETVTFTPPGH